jgi:electron transfer flavoprotein alpha subunit
MLDKHLIVIEHDNVSIVTTSYCAILAASKVTSHITALIMAENKEIAHNIGQGITDKVDNIIYIFDNNLKNRIADSYAEGISHIASSLNFTYIWAGSSVFIKETMPRVNARLSGSSMVSDVQEVIDQDVFKKPMWAGDIIATVKISSKIKIITVRPTDFQGTCIVKDKCIVDEVAYEIKAEAIKFVNFDKIESDRPSLSEADVVVSGGRGVKSKEGFPDLIFPLADALGAAVGASRAVCDAEWVPNDWQVGQTGKIVAPKLYFAVGISGAIQHVAGMRGSKTIVAINKDAEAPIFQVADYGLVGNAEEIVPELIEKLKK